MVLQHNTNATFKRPVDVLTKDGWIEFNTIKDAAAFIGTSHSNLSVCLRKDKLCNGYQVRDHKSNT